MFGHSYNRKSNLKTNRELFSVQTVDFDQFASFRENFEPHNEQSVNDSNHSHFMEMQTESDETEIHDEQIEESFSYMPDRNDLVLYEIASVFLETNLSDSCQRKIYDLMEKLSLRQIILPSYSAFKKQTTKTDVIPFKKYVYCCGDQSFKEVDGRCCSNDHGELVCFDLIESLKYILDSNREYLHSRRLLTRSWHGDFMDSSLYNEIWSETVSESELIRMTLILNIDDASMVKSNKTCVTPISYVVAELPPHRRYVKENVMLASVWWGPCKVNHDDLWQRALLTGIDTFFVNSDVQVKVKIGLIIMDSVAKPKTMNIVQFNGYHGCPYCLIPGKSMKTKRGGHVVIYPYKPNKDYQIKDHNFYLTNAAKASSSSNPIMGVKGSTLLTNYVKFPEQIPIDYMHSILEGVFKSIMGQKPFCDRSFTDKIDSICKTISLPHEFSRKFRKISELIYWKAHECRTFLLYLLPLLRSSLDQEYFVLVMALSCALRILSKKKISSADLDNADKLFTNFLAYYQQKYGEREMKFNFHLLLHLKKQVQITGNLVHSSSFVFEDNIHTLKVSFHGNRGQLSQITKAYQLGKSMSKNNCEPRREWFEFRGLGGRSVDSETLRLPEHIMGKALQGHEIDNHVMKLLSNKYGSIEISKFVQYSRAKKGRTVFHSDLYSYKRKSASFYFAYKENSKLAYGKICYFILLSKSDECHGHDEILVVFKPLIYYNRSTLCTGLTKIKSKNLKEIIGIVKDLNFYQKLKLDQKHNFISFDKIHSKAIVFPDPDDNNIYWGTCMDSAYEHD